MADVFDKEKRSAVMRNIKAKRNKSTELALIKVFREQGVTGWRRGYPIKGHPDFVFIKKRMAVFVDGCFWHGHDCRNTRPKENKAFWEKKIGGNIERDKIVTEMLENRDWTVVRLWECELKMKKRDELIAKLKWLFQ
jgi:DNA mismatch endonuclease (patch repair protein)